MEVEYLLECENMELEELLQRVSRPHEESASTAEKVQEMNEGTEDTLTEYEKARLQNVVRNQQFLHNLGIFNIKSSLEIRVPRRPWTKYVHPRETPLRRSTRGKVPSRRNDFPLEDLQDKKLSGRVGSKKKRMSDEEEEEIHLLHDDEVPVKRKHLFDVDAAAVKEKVVKDIGKPSSEEVDAPEEELTEYEKARLQNVLRNQQFLQNLGVFTIKSALKVRSVPAKRPVTKHVHHPLGATPLRRSIRSKVPSRKSEYSDERIAIPGVISTLNGHSSLTTYMCATAAGSSSSQYHHGNSSSMDWSKVVGFRTLPESLVDRDLERIITMDILADGGFLAVGDVRGRITLFDTNPSCSKSAYKLRSSEPINEEDFERPRLWSWYEWEARRSSYGTPEIQFVSQQPQETTLLLSTFRNGALGLWDLNCKQSSDEAFQPYVRAVHDSLHSKEITGMHEFNGRIATASFDSSLVTSTITETGIAKERAITGHHDGTISGVRFRDANIVADCGQDSRICIVDVRAPNACVSSINLMRRSEIRVVEWSPVQDHILLSTSKLPHLLVHDIRSTGSPLYTLMSHTGTEMVSKVRKYRPAFVGDGSMVATPGERSSMLTLYSLNTGRVISQGFLGFDPTLVLSSSNRRSGSNYGLGNILVPDSADPEFYSRRFRKPRILELTPIFDQEL